MAYNPCLENKNNIFLLTNIINRTVLPRAAAKKIIVHLSIFLHPLSDWRQRTWYFAALLLFLLAGCSRWSIDVDKKFNAQQQALQRKVVEQRLEQLTQIKNWELQGRFSLVTESEAWSGGIYWHQLSNNFLIQFNAPSGQGAIQLSGSSDGVEMKLANGDTYHAKDADTLLRQETSWDLPVSGLWFWIRALPIPKQSYHIKSDEQGHIMELVQNQWRVEYADYQQYGKYNFPRKIVIKNKDTKVRVIVTNWAVS